MRRLSMLLAALTLIGMQTAAQTIRVACIGDSITYGSRINDREQWSYPAQLQAYLGEGYEVCNFGVSGATLLRSGDRPYINTPAFRNAMDFRPDIVLIKLGTNDAKPKNWVHKDDFQKDYQVLIDTLRRLDSHPRIIIVTPLRCFVPEEDPGYSTKKLTDEVRPAVEEVAYRNGLEIINMFNVVPDSWDPGLMPDKMHPSAKGAGLMALKIYEHLTVDAVEPSDSATPFYRQDATNFNFHGYTGYNFKIDGVACRVVEPRIAAKGLPWVWRARFWGHEPQTDIDLLEHGFHIAYCDVADLFGSPQAVKRWDTFYKRMTRAGFSRRVALEGMSRGGLIIYNWAAKNPGRVACIYGDAPVMDITEWPMKYGSPEEVRKMMAAYGFANEEEARAWHGNPLDHAKVIAKARIPVLHVVGDSDKAVPYNTNTQVFEARMKELGVPIQVIHKPATGHHPHSLSCPRPIVDFILRADYD